MCNDHEHHIEYSTEDYQRLCFKHAILEALKDVYVETDVVEECRVTKLYRDCALCEKELIAGISKLE